MIKLSNSAPILSRKQLHSIGAVSLAFSISLTILRQATDSGALPCYRLPSGHRRFAVEDVEAWLGRSAPTQEEEGNVNGVRLAFVCRVSSPGQEKKNSLDYQIERVREFARERFGNEAVENAVLFKRVAGGLFFSHPTLINLCDRVLAGEFDYVIATDASRIARFGHELFATICERGNCEIIYSHADDDLDDRSQLVQDVMMILTSYTSKISGLKAKKLLKVNLSPELLTEAYQLEQSGWTIKDIAKEFSRRKLSDDKNRPFTAWIISVNLNENREVLEQSDIPIPPSSLDLFCDQRVKARKGSRVDRVAFVSAYVAFCRANSLHLIENRRLSQLIRAKGWKVGKNKHKSKCYIGIELTD